VLALSTLSYPLQAPYLISATALSDSSVILEWRNNDFASQGFIIQRKNPGETSFSIIDSVNAVRFTDYGLQPITIYTYRLIAFDSISNSDPSNELHVTTLAKVPPDTQPVLKKPLIYITWDYDTSRSIQLYIEDGGSNRKTGFRIFRADGFSSSFSLIAQIEDSVHSTILFDSAISFFKWYNYKVSVYSKSDSLLSDPCSTYTFHSQPTHVVEFRKLSKFPITMQYTWVGKSGDTLLLKEPSSPAGKFSVINIKDRVLPTFDGYIDSTALLSFPLNTLFPCYFKFGIYNRYSTGTKLVSFKDKAWVLKDSALTMYRFQNGEFTPLATFSRLNVNGMLLINDSLLTIQCGDSIFLHYLSSPDFTDCKVFFWGGGNRLSSNSSFFHRLYMHGMFNNMIISSVDGAETKALSVSPPVIQTSYWRDLIVYDISLGATIRYPGDTPYVNMYNTGHHISPTEFLCIPALPFDYDPTMIDKRPIELFISDVRDPHPNSILKLNRIYADTIKRLSYLPNIILDTVNQRIFLFYTDSLITLGYEREPAGIIPRKKRPSGIEGFSLHYKSCSSGITIVLPYNLQNTELLFYDLSGRRIDRMRNVASNAVLWRPKTRSMGCYFVVVQSGGEKYAEKVFVR
jgi:hypothetical protein